jgi:putative ABC transport system permease protein
VAVVSEAFAEAYFGDRPAIGRLVQILGPDDPPREIVGIVGDVKSGPGSGWTRGPNALAALALAAPAPPMIYVPVTQLSSAALQGVHRTFPMSWVVRTRGPRPELVEEIQAVVRTIEPGLPFVRFESMEMVVARDLQRPRSLTALFGVFSSLAGLLAAIGLYGLIAYLTAQRRKEIGIRMALGARAGTILRQVLRDGLVRALIGVGLGLVAAAALSRTIAGYLFGVDALDPVTFLGVAGLFLLVAGMASLIPARRAARVDPSEALRYQ